MYLADERRVRYLACLSPSWAQVRSRQRIEQSTAAIQRVRLQAQRSSALGFRVLKRDTDYPLFIHPLRAYFGTVHATAAWTDARVPRNVSAGLTAICLSLISTQGARTAAIAGTEGRYYASKPKSSPYRSSMNKYCDWNRRG